MSDRCWIKCLVTNTNVSDAEWCNITFTVCFKYVKIKKLWQWTDTEEKPPFLFSIERNKRIDLRWPLTNIQFIRFWYRGFKITIHWGLSVSISVSGTFVPGNFRPRGRKFHRVELSLTGTKVPWNFRPLVSFHRTFDPCHIILNFRSSKKYRLLDCRKFAVDEIIK